MKKLIPILFIILGLPISSFAQTNTHQGGTGLVDIAPNSIPFGSIRTIRMATSSGFQFAPTTNTLSATYASTTAASATWLCLTADCRSTWPAAATFGQSWEINSSGLLAPTTTKSIAVNGTASSTFAAGVESPRIGSQYYVATSSTATSTFAGGFSALNYAQTGTATSTFLNGMTIASGCFAKANVCLQFTDIAGTLAVNKGGTGATTLTGLLQGNGTSAFTAITDSSTVGQILRVTGASTYAWGQLNLASTNAVTGTLPVGNGGTGSTAFSNSTLIASNASGNLISTSTIAFQSFYATSTATSTSLGGLDVQQLNVGSTTATSTFQGGLWNVGGGLKLGTIKSCSSPNALQTDSNGGVICAAISATVTGPNSSLAAFNGSGSLIGTSTIAFQSFFATSTTATSTILGSLMIGTSAFSGSLLPGSIFGASHSFAGPGQVNFSNISTAITASESVVLGNSKSTNTTYYTEFGQNSSLFSIAAESAENKDDGFLISSDAALVIGTASSTNSLAQIRFVCGGLASSSICGLFTQTGNFGISSTTPGVKLAVTGVGVFTDNLFAPRFIATSTSLISTFTNSTTTNASFTSWLGIPNAANPTVSSVAGTLAMDTTAASTSFQFGDGTAARAIYAAQDKTWTLSSSTLAYIGAFGTAGTTTIRLANYNRPITLQNFYCKTTAGTAWVGFGSGSATTSEIQASTSGAQNIVSANNTWIARQDFYIEVGFGSSLGVVTCTASVLPGQD